MLTQTTWSMGYPMTDRTPHLARFHVRRRLTIWRWAGEVDDAVLVVSELVTNAVRHGRVPGHQLWLRLEPAGDDGALTVDVSDPVSAFPGVPAEIKSEAIPERGRGLLLVAQLAAELTWFPRPHVGKTVRARLAGPEKTCLLPQGAPQALSRHGLP